MRTDGNLGRTATYFPNCRGEWTDQPQLNEPPLAIDGAAAHWDHRVDDDHYKQPGDLFRKMNVRLCSITRPARSAQLPNTSRSVTSPIAPEPIRRTAQALLRRLPASVRRVPRKIAKLLSEVGRLRKLGGVGLVGSETPP
jgi:hypothetical protein